MLRSVKSEIGQTLYNKCEERGGGGELREENVCAKGNGKFLFTMHTFSH